MARTVAVVFGTFAPLHTGHVDLIQRAKSQCSRVAVVVSGYAGDRGDQIGLDLSKRFEAIGDTFVTDSLVSVFALDEKGLPPYPDGWDPWLDRLLQMVVIESEEKLIFYVSEEEYAKELEKRGFEVSYTGRRFGISATLIRGNPKAYRDFISPAFRRYFSVT